MQIMANFSSSMPKFLDDRQKWTSIDSLRSNTEILMPVGFQVYCIADASWYELKSATDEKDPSTYTWEKLTYDVYTKSEIDNKLDAKANSSDVYTKSNVYTKSETDNAITSKVSEIVAGAPEDFDTLKEMSDWISEHEDSAADMNSAIQTNTNNITSLQSGKVDKVTGKGLSTNDYTTADKTKLDGIATGANNYSLPTATSSVLGGVKTGSNITNSSGTISLTKANVTSALGYTPPTTNTTYSNFVKSGSGAAAGLVPAPSTTAGTTKYLREDGTWTVPPNTTYSAATTSAAGLMSAADKTKLDGIATGANKITVDSALSSTSTNPIQNKVINTALSGKVDKVTGKGLSTNDFTDDCKKK